MTMKRSERSVTTKKRGFPLYAGCALLLIIALFAAFVLRYRFWWAYGIYDSLRPGKSHLLTEVQYGRDSLLSVPIDKISNGDTDITYSNILWLVNSEHMLSEKDIPAIAEIGDGYSINYFAQRDMEALFSECESKFGKEILLVSTYRSHDLQASIYETNPYAVPAGTSEHETGLAADIKVDGYAQMRFIMSDVGRWINRSCWEYGFIIRYPFWGRAETGVTYEPWHLRYVGALHAEIIYKSKITLEKYSGLYSAGKFYSYGNYIISYQYAGDGTLIYPDGLSDVWVSPDNTGGYFIWGEKS